MRLNCTTLTASLELEELAAENGLSVNREEIRRSVQKHQELSRAGSEQVFKGGLADHSDETTAYHTATHLLQKALKMVLGDHVAQRGSNITAERMRFDFSHPEPMTPEQIAQVEKIVNEQISADLSVTMEMMPLEKARSDGAMALFGEKYEDTVGSTRSGTFQGSLRRPSCGTNRRHGNVHDPEGAVVFFRSSPHSSRAVK